MRYLIHGTFTFLIQRLRDVKSWLVLLLMPILVLAVMIWLPKEEVAAPVQVGVCLPEDGADELWDLLEERSGTVLQFVVSTEEQIDRNVAAGKWDCGLIVAEDFEERLEEMDTDRIFTLRISTGSSVYPLVQETVAACAARLCSAGVAEEYLRESAIGLTEESRMFLKERLRDTVSDSERVLVTMKTADGRKLNPLSVAERGLDELMRWAISAVMLVHMLLCAADLGKWFSLPSVRRLVPLRSATMLLTARIGADAILVIAAGCAAALLLGDGFLGCLAVTGYVIFWGVLAVVAARCQALWPVLPVLPSFAVVISLLHSSILVDASVLLPFLGGIAEWSPVALYLRICSGDLMGAVVLVGIPAVVLLISGLRDK